MAKKTALLFLILIGNCYHSQTNSDSYLDDPLFISAYDKYEKKLYHEAYEDYSTYLRKKPNDANALYNRGLCSYDETDYKSALRDFRSSTSFGRRKDDVYYMKGLCNYYLKNYSAAVQDFDSSLIYKPGSAEALCYKGASLNELKKYSEALIALNASQDSKPDFEPTYYFRNITKYYLQDYKGSLDDCNNALALKNYYETHFWKGVALIELDRYKEGIIEYDTVIAHNPKYARAYYNRGLAYY
ncbi:MAG: tetratricopeptide repeat protein, partial [Bacteroidia bacterium]